MKKIGFLIIILSLSFCIKSMEEFEHGSSSAASSSSATQFESMHARMDDQLLEFPELNARSQPIIHLSQAQKDRCLAKLPILLGDARALTIRVVINRLINTQDRIQPFFISGPIGVGKKEIAHVIGKLVAFRIMEANIEDILSLNESPKKAAKDFFDIINLINDPVVLIIEGFEGDRESKGLSFVFQFFKQNYNQRPLLIICVSLKMTELFDNCTKILINLPENDYKVQILQFYLTENNITFDPNASLDPARHVSMRYIEQLIQDSINFTGKDLESIVISAVNAIGDHFDIPEKYRTFTVTVKGYIWNSATPASLIEKYLNMYHQLKKEELLAVKAQIAARQNAALYTQAKSEATGFGQRLWRAIEDGFASGVQQGINQSTSDYVSRYTGESEKSRAERSARIEIMKEQMKEKAQAQRLQERYASGEMLDETIHAAKIEAAKNAYLAREQARLEAEGVEKKSSKLIVEIFKI